MVERKTNRIVFGVPFSGSCEKYKRLYRMLGYTEMNTHYIKKLRD